MGNAFAVMLLVPFVGFVLFGLAWLIASLVLRFVPAGRMRRLLTRQVGARGANPRRYAAWK